ncbi:MAG: YkoF family thiamine/hydroxymethylpyrimidine-binding protein [Steroidobacteraceae bacterium]|nr:hypothetical protein [Nevskiaceae bacterium]MCP5472424.1 hypothetical protein [Nevskiaceae bacterium]
MDIAVDISLYPLEQDFVPPIREFIDRLGTDPRLKVVTNSLSTQLTGPYEVVMETLTRELRPSFERGTKSVFVVKLLGPLPAY